MHDVLEAAIRFVNATTGPRKLEVQRLRELEQAVRIYKDHQGVSDSSSKRSISSCSMRSASRIQ
jgi:hypothetical protein